MRDDGKVRAAWVLIAALVTLVASPQGLASRPGPVVQLEPRRFGTPTYDTVWGLAGYPSGVYLVGSTDGELHGFASCQPTLEPHTYLAGSTRGELRDLARCQPASEPYLYFAGGADGELHGQRKSDAFIRKVDAEGRVLWAEQFGTAEADDAWGVATDARGNVYVVGSTEGALAGASHGGADGFVRKYSAAGRVLWTRQFGTEEEDHLVGIATSGDAVYVVGHREGAEVTKALVMKLDSSGAEGWLEVYGDSGVSYASGVATDGEGNAYVGGITADVFTEDAALRLDMVLRKYTPAGAVLWTKRLDYGERETASGVAVLGPNVYLAGYYTYGDDLGNRDARVVQFSTDGVRGWDKRFDLGGNDYLWSLSALAGGLVFAGETVSPAGHSDGYVVKLNPADGSELWQTKLTTPKTDLAWAVVGTLTGVYVAGESGGTPATPEETDAFLVRLHGDTGEPLWINP